MNTRKTLALALAGLGLLLAIAGPFLPGGVHLTLKDPPRSGHVTSLTALPNGDVLAGTQTGEVWRLQSGRWTRAKLNIGGEPVLAMIDAPGRAPVGTAAGLADAPVGTPPLEGRVSSLLRTDRGLLAGTASGVRLLANGRWQAPGPEANIYSLLKQRRGDGEWLHAATVGAGLLSTPAADAGAPWQPNNLALPDGLNVFSLATTTGGLLLAGTNQGLFWQSSPGQPWQSLHPGLDGQRVLSLYPDTRGTRLWIGRDDGLYWLDIAEQDATLTVTGELTAADSPAYQPPLGVSWIVAAGDRVMISAGAVYAYGSTQLAGWYWISLAGVVLILIAGWLTPRPETAASQSGA